MIIIFLFTIFFHFSLPLLAGRQVMKTMKNWSTDTFGCLTLACRSWLPVKNPAFTYCVSSFQKQLLPLPSTFPSAKHHTWFTVAQWNCCQIVTPCPRRRHSWSRMLKEQQQLHCSVCVYTGCVHAQHSAWGLLQFVSTKNSTHITVVCL